MQRPSHTARLAASHRPVPPGAALSGSKPTVRFDGNQARLRGLQAAVGAQAGALAALAVSHPGDVEERAARDAAANPAEMLPRTRPAAGPGPLAQALGPGAPLPPEIATAIAPRPHAAFADVRLHTGPKAGRTAAALGARAVTLGGDIAFAEGAYAPQSARGQRLLVHELAHVAQHGVLPRLFRDEESEADVDQRVLKGMTDIVNGNPMDDETRLKPLVDLFGTVPQSRIAHLYHRLDPGAPTDDFAQFFKDKFTKTRADGLGFLRNHVTAGLPGTSAGFDTDVGANTGIAATSLPTGIPFATSMGGRGWIFNPKYWVLKYTLIKGGLTRDFVGTEGADPPLVQFDTFMQSSAGKPLEGGTLDVELSFGQFGGTQALNDLWNPASASKYAFECLEAAWLVQLRGRYLSYPKASRDVDFDRDNKSYTQHFTTNGLPKRSNETDFDEIPLKDPIKLSDTDKLSAALKVGDEATFANPFVNDNPAFEHENVIYLGNLHFMGHPFGTFTLSEYAANLTRYAPKDTPDDKKADWVLDHATIQDISRPKQK